MIREPYTETYIKNSAGKKRSGTKGRYGSTETTYNAHPMGALPRDVIKVPALAGGAGRSERVDHPTQKPMALTEILIKSCMQKEGIVLIPFAGSGTECVVSKRLGLPFIGIDNNSEYVTLAMRRVNEVDE